MQTKALVISGLLSLLASAGHATVIINGTYTTRAGPISAPDTVLHTDAQAEFSATGSNFHTHVISKGGFGNPPPGTATTGRPDAPWALSQADGEWNNVLPQPNADDLRLQTSTNLSYNFFANGPTGRQVEIGLFGILEVARSQSYQTPFAKVAVVDLNAPPGSRPLIEVDTANLCGSHQFPPGTEDPCTDVISFIDDTIVGTAGHLYQVLVETYVVLELFWQGFPVANATASAYADPYFFVRPDQPDASLFSLTFSPNVNNAPPASVPEPASVGMLLTGLAMLGWFSRRRPRIEG